MGEALAELLVARNHQGEIMHIARLAVATVVALAIATPASAQVSGLTKRVKEKAGQKVDPSAADSATDDPAEATAPGAAGGMIVLTDEVVSQLLAGLKAGQADREAAAKENTPYGRFKKAEAAYAEAKPKCDAAQQTFAQTAGTDEKRLEKMNAFSEKMLAAQSKQDYKLMQIYQDSSLAMIDPSCIVKQPEQPKDYNQAQRDIDVQAEQQEATASGFTPSELAMVKERAIAIIQGSTPPGDASPSEKSAVSAKSDELKPLLGLAEEPAARAAKPAPAPAPAPAAAPAPDPEMSAAASDMSACMAKNIQSHQAEIEALAERAQAAQAANNTQKLLAIADTVQRIQMAGCTGR
jgi:hypothetical protein